MKRLTTQILFAAAALTAVAVSAPAQTMKAEVPFRFHAGEYAMAPGAYEVKVMASPRAVVLRSPDTGKTVMVLMAHDRLIPPDWKSNGHARLRFDCGGPRCVLRDVWTGSGSRAVTIVGPKPESLAIARIREILLSGKIHK